MCAAGDGAGSRAGGECGAEVGVVDVDAVASEVGEHAGGSVGGMDDGQDVFGCLVPVDRPLVLSDGRPCARVGENARVSVLRDRGESGVFEAVGGFEDAVDGGIGADTVVDGALGVLGHGVGAGREDRAGVHFLDGHQCRCAPEFFAFGSGVVERTRSTVSHHAGVDDHRGPPVGDPFGDLADEIGADDGVDVVARDSGVHVVGIVDDFYRDLAAGAAQRKRGPLRQAVGGTGHQEYAVGHAGLFLGAPDRSVSDVAIPRRARH